MNNINSLYVKTKSDIWIAIITYSLILSPLLGYIGERIWKDTYGMDIIGWGFFGILLLLLLSRIQRFRISSYAILAALYYLFTVAIPWITTGKLLLTFDTNLQFSFFVLILANCRVSDELLKRSIRWIIWLIAISLFAIIIQSFYNPLFLVSNLMRERFSWWSYSNYGFRPMSIWSYVNSTAGGYTIIAVYSIVLGYFIEIKKNAWKIAYLSSAILIYCILSQQRWILIVYVIISSQLYRLFNRTVNQIILLLVLCLFIGLLIYFGYPLMDVVQYRYLDKDAGGIAHGSWQSRVANFDAFNRFFRGSWLFGIASSGQEMEVAQFLDRGTNQLLLGTINPLFTYGIIGSIWFYLIFYYALRSGYRIGRKTKNYGFFVLFIGILVGGFSNTFILADPGTMLAFIFMKNYEDKLRMTGNEI